MEATLHSFIQAIGWSIVHSFWQGAIVYAVLFLTIISLPKLSPAAKHNLSYLSICGIFIWFVATFIQQWHIPEIAPVNAYLPGEHSIFISTTTDWKLADIEVLFPAITGLYLIGFLVHSFILYKGYLVLQKFRKTELEAVPADWEHICYKVIARLNINKQIDFHTSYLAKVPMVIGYFKPVILFPASLVTTLDTDQVEAILIHELAHIRRNDYLLNLIKTFMDALLFFNPFVWLAGRFIKIEREHICDDMVLKYTGQPVKYAHTLLQIEMTKGVAPQAAMAVSGKKQYLFDRIKRMTNMKTNYMNVKQQLAGITIVIVAVFCLAWLVPSDSLPVKGEKNPSHSSNKPSGILNSNIAESASILKDTIIEPKKKKEIKIIVTEPDGKTQEYNSLKGIPDSVKEDMGIFQGKSFSFIGDSLLLHTKDLRKSFNGIFNDTVFLRGQKEIAEHFKSPEFNENMREAFRSINSPEFKKEMADLKAELNSGKFKQEQKEILKKLNSAEFKQQQAELKKYQGELKNSLKIRGFKDGQKDLVYGLNADVFTRLPRLTLEGSDLSLSADSLFITEGNKNNFRIFIESRERVKRDKALDDNKQYQKLKKKFEKDVEKLRKKQADAEKDKK